MCNNELRFLLREAKGATHSRTMELSSMPLVPAMRRPSLIEEAQLMAANMRGARLMRARGALGGLRERMAVMGKVGDTDGDTLTVASPR